MKLPDIKTTIIPTIAILLILLMASCSKCRHDKPSYTYRHSLDSIAQKATSYKALDSLYKNMQAKGNTLGQIVTVKEWGKRLRDESRFDEALHKHNKERQLAEKVNDTLEIVQALNNLGTVYRRIGILDVAQHYHYKALMLAQECSDTSFTAKKNRVISLNGLANVYLTLGNLERADSIFRMALAGEKALHSDLGQAINYANLGAIFEERGKTDSAWAYYKKSMALNKRINDQLGISLCHNYFGNLYEKERRYDKALAEYEQAYKLMQTSKDEWHTLSSVIAMANVYIDMNDVANAEKYLSMANNMATKIKSNEHLVDIYTLYYKLYKQCGDYRQALAYHEKASGMHKKLINMEKVNRMHNTSIAIERGRQVQKINKAEKKLKDEKTLRVKGYIFFGVIIFLLLCTVGALIYARHTRAKSYKAMKKLGRLRENFFTNITHEFRTPLTIILGLSHEIQIKNASADEIKDMAKTIERQGQGLLGLINQLLDIAKVRSAIGNPDWRKGNIAAYINMIVENFNEYAVSSGLNLTFKTTEKSIETDFVPDYINKMISNLLANALKFTPKGGSVNVEVHRFGEHILIDVSDTGAGIPQEDIKHVFEPFYQSSTESYTAGTGVGLSLVQHIVNNLKGSISVESHEGKGTIFKISLPIVHGKAQTMEIDKHIVSNGLSHEGSTEELNVDTGKEQHRENVLVVEDSKDVATYIGRILDDKYNVIYASDGKSGLEKAKETVPDIIISDVMMPVMDGLQLCKEIRDNEVTNHIPIIIVTAKITDDDKLNGLKAGADAYLAKPFNSNELMVRVQKLLEQRKLLREKYLSQNVNDNKATASGVENKFINRVNDSIYSLISSHKKVDVNSVADMLCMSYTQLYRKISAVTGLTPSQYFQRIKVGKAQMMLAKHPEKSLNEVAELCGFSDYSNFVRAFKNVTGNTPSQQSRTYSGSTSK